MLRLQDLSFHYNGNGSAGVDAISMDLQPGEFMLLLGRTGAGKSTLLKLISLDLFPQRGEIFLERLRSRELRRRDYPTWRRRLGVVFQDFRLLTDRTVLQNIALSASCDRSLSAKPRARALKMLAAVGLSHKLHSYPSELSGGEQQRAAIARALVNEPILVLADEPVSDLDSQTAGEIADLFHRINKTGAAVVVATHQPERFMAISPRVVELERGRLKEQ